MLDSSLKISLFILSLLLPAFASAQSTLVVPSESQVKWHEAEMGALFHYDLHVFDGKRYEQSLNRITPIEDHNIFSPTALNTDQWVLAVKAAGCRFALLTATHETGFGLWQSDVNPYCMKALKWQDSKGDIVRDFVESCRKYGIEPGLYIGIRWNSHLGICNFNPKGEGPYYEKRKAWYKHYCEQMVEELCTRYGPLHHLRRYSSGRTHQELPSRSQNAEGMDNTLRRRIRGAQAHRHLPRHPHVPAAPRGEKVHHPTLPTRIQHFLQVERGAHKIMVHPKKE